MADACFEIIAGEPDSRIVLTCDHASNRIPPDVAPIGLSEADLNRHIAYDVGARGLTLALAKRLGGQAVLNRVSRIVIDPNRGPDDPTLVRRIYDRSVVPGNRHVDAAEVARRMAAHYTPYHNAVREAVDGVLARGEIPVVIAIHSFTPQLANRPPRPWHVGILWDGRDGRVAQPLMQRLRQDGWCVGDNEPYSGKYEGDSLDRHAMQRGLPNVLIELRNDLIADNDAQATWADHLAAHLADLLADPSTYSRFEG
ncbi:N-formylglutamate amidohydrolase [Pontivivens insulae]|uniref:N-formylglutamate amidohydrolase n=1 Tax=Pontivivens insulae TaxID=1639689 RepID=A0A2R8AFQ8_9RHOB|nr:N-formylglutamate amidohydrolase [Pontivivens insulae]RED12326.1 putative N-formylglutamate amidohydrolase [Pontivivens insulae]SPF31082.1 hypothetical protein POI8812_03433 [Pontivivens insulae]